MRTLKQHIDSVKHAMNAAQSAVKGQEIINATNISANTIAGLFPIGQLMEKLTVSPGTRLPANLAGISIVRDASTQERMWERGEGAVGSDEEVGRFHIDIDRAATSAIGFPFKSTGSINEDGSKLTCPDMISLATGAYLYVRKVSDTVYNTRYDDNGDAVFDDDGNLVLYAVPAGSFYPELPGVRFYNSGTTNNAEIVYFDENEDLAYWNNITLGWILTEIADVGVLEPDGYFDIVEGVGEGEGTFSGLYLSLEIIEQSGVETISDDDFTDLTVCITNAINGDFYYRIKSVNEDNTFNLLGTHPFAETDSLITIFRESTSRIHFTDFSEQAITSGSFDVYYWMYPNPLTQDEDIIPFAYPNYLELLTVRRLPETRERRPVSKKELDEAKMIAKRKEPKQLPPSQPRTAQGSVFGMGAATSDTYTPRGG